LRTWEAVVSNDFPVVIDAGILYTPKEKLAPARVVIDGNRIVEVGPPARVALPTRMQRIDASAMVVMPGFIEPHIHGIAGVDVMDGTFNALNTVSRALARHGTTSFLPTTVSSPSEILSSAIARIGESLHQTFDGARPLGIHLEGPFINVVKRGTHKPTNVAPADPELLRQWIAASGNCIRLITIAPELPDSLSVAKLALSHDVRVAMGHSDATFEEATAAVGCSVNYAVHTFNAMRAFSHRDPGIVGAVLSDDRIFAEIIADGVHVSPSVVKFFARAKRADRILLVTDAISATDMPDGAHRLGPDTVTVTDGICRDESGRLAGSTLTQETALKNFIEWSGFPVEHAVQALTLNPANALGLRGKGMIEPGADADITVLDANFRVMKTFVAGKLVYER